MAEFSFVRGTRMRATLTDECGLPSTVAGDNIVTKGFITVGYSPQIKDRDEVEVIGADGSVCVTSTVSPQLKWYDLQLAFCKVNPELFTLLTGQPIVENSAAEPVGIDITDNVATTGFGLEVWTDIAGGGVCAGGASSHGYVLAPWLTEGFLTDFTIENGAITFTISARTNRDHQWGVGPYDVVAGGTGVAGPLLAPLDPSVHLRLMQTTVDPPAVPA